MLRCFLYGQFFRFFLRKILLCLCRLTGSFFFRPALLCLLLFSLAGCTGCLLFRLSALSFYQINRVQTEKLYGQALEFAALTGSETVADAYCGAGTISLCMAKNAKRVIGVEIVPEAIADAKENAARNGVENAEFIVGACEEVLPKLVKEGLKPDVVMLDPPRKGCEEAVLTAAAQTNPKRIVYVSCNPATLARDAKRLAAMGYPMKKLRVCDMFSWTGEAECVALFDKE